MKLGEYLIQKGLLTEEQLNIALNEQKITGEKLGEILIRFNFVKRKDIINALTLINPHSLIAENLTIAELPIDFLLNTETVVLGDIGDKFYIATLNPDPFKVKEQISKMTNKEVSLVSYPTDAIYQKLNDLKKIESVNKTERIKNFIDSGNISGAINELITDALDKRASDIHLEPGDKSLLIRYRIDGVLYILYHLPITVYSQISAAIKNQAGMDIAETRLPQDGSFSCKFQGRYINLRIATLPTQMGEKISIRLLDKEKMLIDINELGMTHLDKWLDISQKQMGLILVCGPTGSGKTTTLYATLQWLDKIHRNVYSIEEPVEYQLPFINQVQVNRRAGLDFATYLRTIVRHDPDVIVVGEIRDRETAENALTLADTGHLVYSTLHTNDVASTLVRLQGLGVDLNALSFLLRGILVQRLVRKICKYCGGAGCSVCLETGYYGRTMVSEIASFDSYRDVQNLIAGNYEYYTFYEDCKYKVLNGITTKEEILRAVGLKLDI